MNSHRTHGTAPAAAAGIRVRDMTDADCEAVARIRVRGWQTAYAGLMPAAFLDAMSVEKDTALRRELLVRQGSYVVNLVAERAGEVVGWACHGPPRDDDVPPGDAELYAVYVRTDALSTGVGRALLDVTLSRCAAAGHACVRLWVLEGNARARRFYESAGFSPDGAEEPYEVAGTPVPELRYARELPGTGLAPDDAP